MALSIVNNSTAIGAQGSVNNANNQLAKTIKALSTGLRINSAADDASGLAVSEKLRGQISGLAKAATNAQDAISMLQTAEGAMGSMTSMVQRIRELAVQAGDPAYTSNDRAMLQLEVDQLKEEIDRVSSSTEFNTKKLLNGDAAALWSSSSDNIEAIVKGAAAEGNYRITYDVDPGQNSVYKSNIMQLGAGQYSYSSTANESSIARLENISGMMKTDPSTDPQLAISVDSGQITANLGTGTIGFTGTGWEDFAANTNAQGSFTVEAEVLTASGNETVKMRVRLRDTDNGELSEWVEISQSATETTSAVFTFANNVTVSVTGMTFINDGTTLKKGDKMLAALGGAVTGTSHVRISSQGTLYPNQGTGFLTVALDEAASAANVNKTHTLYTAQIDEAGNIYYGQMDIVMDKVSSVKTGVMSVEVLGEGDVASENTKLSQITSFTNADGRMVLDNTQEISIYAGNGKTAKITIEGNDTIADLQDKLNSALVEQLGLGAPETKSGANTVNQNLVKFISDPTKGNNAVGGTFIIQGAVLGSDSNLTFVGDEGVLSAFGLTQIQEAKESKTNVTVFDAHTGDFIGEANVTDGRVRNVIEGVDINIQPSSELKITYGTDGKLSFESTGTRVTDYLHIKDNATKAAIGANEGQTLDISIGRLDTKSLGIDGITVGTFDDAQKAITKLDMALEQISAARATAGAQMNRLEYTISNLNTTRENMVASESRIRDLDIAQASSDLTAQQVVLQSATAMLAQANQIPSYAMQLLG